MSSRSRRSYSKRQRPSAISNVYNYQTKGTQVVGLSQQKYTIVHDSFSLGVFKQSQLVPSANGSCLIMAFHLHPRQLGVIGNKAATDANYGLVSSWLTACEQYSQWGINNLKLSIKNYIPQSASGSIKVFYVSDNLTSNGLTESNLEMQYSQIRESLGSERRCVEIRPSYNGTFHFPETGMFQVGLTTSKFVSSDTSFMSPNVSAGYCVVFLDSVPLFESGASSSNATNSTNTLCDITVSGDIRFAGPRFLLPKLNIDPQAFDPASQPKSSEPALVTSQTFAPGAVGIFGWLGQQTNSSGTLTNAYAYFGGQQLNSAGQKIEDLGLPMRANEFKAQQSDDQATLVARSRILRGPKNLPYKETRPPRNVYLAAHPSFADAPFNTAYFSFAGLGSELNTFLDTARGFINDGLDAFNDGISSVFGDTIGDFVYDWTTGFVFDTIPYGNTLKKWLASSESSDINVPPISGLDWYWNALGFPKLLGQTTQTPSRAFIKPGSSVFLQALGLIQTNGAVPGATASQSEYLVKLQEMLNQGLVPLLSLYLSDNLSTDISSSSSFGSAVTADTTPPTSVVYDMELNVELDPDSGTLTPQIGFGEPADETQLVSSGSTPARFLAQYRPVPTKSLKTLISGSILPPISFNREAVVSFYFVAGGYTSASVQKGYMYFINPTWTFTAGTATVAPTVSMPATAILTNPDFSATTGLTPFGLHRSIKFAGASAWAQAENTILYVPTLKGTIIQYLTPLVSNNPAVINGNSYPALGNTVSCATDPRNAKKRIYAVDNFQPHYGTPLAQVSCHVKNLYHFNSPEGMNAVTTFFPFFAQPYVATINSPMYLFRFQGLLSECFPEHSIY